jgi:tetratricopeptide (TPR) repeat protein
MKKSEMNLLSDNEEINSKEKKSEFLLFLTLWDEELGCKVLEYHPKSFLGDLESLSRKIFSTFQLVENNPGEQYKKRKTVLPVAELNKTAYILLDTKRNREVRGGLQPFIIVMLVPDHFSKTNLEKFDPIILKIAKKYQNEKIISVEENFPEIEEIGTKELEIKDSGFEIDENYSYTAAVDDFKAGVQLLQTKNYDAAYPVLNRAFMKFEQDVQKNLLMETTYLIGSLFAQKKDFKTAEKYFLRLETLAEELNHQKYNEISAFMSGFCAFKNKKHMKAIQEFSRIELIKKNFINEFQYYTIFGKALENLKDYEEAIKKFKFALRIIEGMEETALSTKQKGQTIYELGMLNYKQYIARIKESGLDEQKIYNETLEEAIKFFERSDKFSQEIGDNLQIINVSKMLGDIYEYLGDNSKFFQYYNRALENAEKVQDISYQIQILKRIIQKQEILGMYEDCVEKISTFLNEINDYALIDLYTKSSFHHLLGISLIKTNNKKEGLSELITAYEILDKFRDPVDEEIDILQEIISLCNEIGDSEKTTNYTEKLKEVTEKLEEKRTEKTQTGKILKFLKDIWFFSKSVGCEIYNYSPEIGVETDLLGGFMTAMQALSQEITYKTFDSLIYGRDRFTIYQEENRDFYILARSDIKISEEAIKMILTIIYNRFWKEYFNEITEFQGNITSFRNFTDILKSFDWNLLTLDERERITSLREKITETSDDIKKLIK